MIIGVGGRYVGTALAVSIFKYTHDQSETRLPPARNP